MSFSWFILGLPLILFAASLPPALSLLSMAGWTFLSVTLELVRWLSQFSFLDALLSLSLSLRETSTLFLFSFIWGGKGARFFFLKLWRLSSERVAVFLLSSVPSGEDTDLGVFWGTLGACRFLGLGFGTGFTETEGDDSTGTLPPMLFLKDSICWVLVKSSEVETSSSEESPKNGFDSSISQFSSDWFITFGGFNPFCNVSLLSKRASSAKGLLSSNSSLPDSKIKSSIDSKNGFVFIFFFGVFGDGSGVRNGFRFSMLVSSSSFESTLSSTLVLSSISFVLESFLSGFGIFSMASVDIFASSLPSILSLSCILSGSFLPSFSCEYVSARSFPASAASCFPDKYLLWLPISWCTSLRSMLPCSA